MKLMNDFLENKLNECKIKRYLPKNNPLANYLPFLLIDNFVFISGQLPITTNGIESPGKIKKKVELGIRNNGMVEIIEGLKSNDVVVFEGINKIQEGSVVTVK